MIKMNKNLTYIGVLFVCLLLGGLSSCKKDKKTALTAVELLSFGLAGAEPNGAIQLIGNNLDKVTAVEFTGGASVASSSFIKQTKENIQLLVPNDASPGSITLKTSQGNVTSKSPLNLLVTPTIITFTNSTKAEGLVTVTGNYLNWINTITIGGKDKVTTFESQSLTELVFEVPKWIAAGSYTLNFKYGGTKPNTLQPTELLTVIP